MRRKTGGGRDGRGSRKRSPFQPAPAAQQKTQPAGIPAFHSVVVELRLAPVAALHVVPDLSPRLHAEPGGSVIIIIMMMIRTVRGERANFTRLVLGCIEANFCK